MLRLQAKIREAAASAHPIRWRIQSTASALKKVRANVQADIAAEAKIFVQQMRMMDAKVPGDRMPVGQRQMNAEVQLRGQLRNNSSAWRCAGKLVITLAAVI